MTLQNSNVYVSNIIAQDGSAIIQQGGTIVLQQDTSFPNYTMVVSSGNVVPVLDLSSNPITLNCNNINIIGDSVILFDNNPTTTSSKLIVDNLTISGGQLVLQLTSFPELGSNNFITIQNIKSNSANAITSRNSFFEYNINDGALSVKLNNVGISNFNDNITKNSTNSFNVSNMMTNLTSSLLTTGVNNNELAPTLLHLGYMTDQEQVTFLETESTSVAQGAPVSQENNAAQSAFQIGARQSGLALASLRGNDEENTGVSAGDSFKKMGAWTNGFMGCDNQKTRKSSQDYKTHTYGGIVGFDQEISDSTMLGIAGSIAKGSMRHQGVKTGDLTKSNTYILTLYGNHELGNNWLTRGHIMAGKSYMKSREKHLVRTGGIYTTSTGKYNAMLYSAELLGGYKYRVTDSINILPTFGAIYSWFGKSHYSEAGTNLLHRRTINQKAKDRFAGILGIEGAMKHDLSKVDLTTGLHARVEYDFLAKSPQSSIILNGVINPIVTSATKPARTMYNLGADVIAKYGCMEYGFRYDSRIAEKYLGHQGSIKVRVNL